MIIENFETFTETLKRAIKNGIITIGEKIFVAGFVEQKDLENSDSSIYQEFKNHKSLQVSECVFSDSNTTYEIPIVETKKTKKETKVVETILDISVVE